MSLPSVTAVCLTADRQDFTDRAVRCFLRQTYEDKHLLIYDNGKKPYRMNNVATSQIELVRVEPRGASIGELRNEANALVKSDVIVHWDSDDVSTPWRMTRSLADLGGNAAAGCFSLTIWDSTVGEAWMYSNDAVFSLGTSLIYRRDVWQRTPFEHQGRGEDLTWGRKIGVCRLTNVVETTLIAQKHKGNPGIKIVPGACEWRRCQELDSVCKQIMEEA